MGELIPATGESEIIKKLIILVRQSRDKPMLHHSLKAGLKGILQGLKERELPLATSLTLFPLLSGDIENEYNKYYPDLDYSVFLTECREYGIKLVYYHEWQAYEKNTCY